MEYLRTLLDYMATCFYGAELLNYVRTFVSEIFFLFYFPMIALNTKCLITGEEQVSMK